MPIQMKHCREEVDFFCLINPQVGDWCYIGLESTISTC